MTSYRRNFLPGGSFFFTVALADRRSALLTHHIDQLRAAFRYARDRYPFIIDAVVVLSDHLRTIWTLPDGDKDFSLHWRLIKAAFSRAQPVVEPISASRVSRSERGIWQRRFWKHTLRDERDAQVHADYIHFNPMKHGYVGRACDWPYSSFRAMVRKGIYPVDWGGDVRDVLQGFGER